jgi:hypothetical protein
MFIILLLAQAAPGAAACWVISGSLGGALRLELGDVFASAS